MTTPSPVDPTSPDGRLDHTSAPRDLLVLLALGTVIYASALRFDLFDRLVEGVRRSEALWGGALIVSALALAVALKVYAWRRWREWQRERVVRTRVEAALRRERDFADAVLATAGSLILVLDRQGHIVRFNRSCAELTGYTPDELHGRPFWDVLLLADEAARVREVFAELRSGRFPNTHENHWVTRAGQHRLIAWANTALLDDTGAVGHVVATGIDITEQRAVEVALRDSEARFRAVYEHAAIGIVLADLDRRIVACNPAYEKLLGHTEEELRAAAFPLATHPDDAPCDAALFARLVAGQGDAYRLEKRYVHKDGSVIHGHLTASLVRDPAGHPQYIIGLVQDLTALTTATARLQEQSVSLRRVESGLSAQEWKVLALLCQGHLNPEIATRLFIQPETVRRHIHNIGLKLGLETGGRDVVRAAALEEGFFPAAVETDSTER